MHARRLPDHLAEIIDDRRTTLLVARDRQPAILVSLEEYQRFRTVYDWHARLKMG